MGGDYRSCRGGRRWEVEVATGRGGRGRLLAGSEGGGCWRGERGVAVGGEGGSRRGRQLMAGAGWVLADRG